MIRSKSESGRNKRPFVFFEHFLERFKHVAGIEYELSAMNFVSFWWLDRRVCSSDALGVVLISFGLHQGKAQMSEIVFVVEIAPEGGYIARALGASIFTEADTEAELRLAVQDAVHCHFDQSSLPKVIRLHFVRDELMAA